MADLVGNVLSAKRGGNVSFDVKSTLREDPKELGWVIRRAIRGPDSHWPTRSGKSKRGFRVRVSSRGLLVTNRYTYAYIVEASQSTRTRGGGRWGTGIRYPLTETIAEAIDRNVTGDTSIAGSFLAGVAQGVRGSLR